MTNSVVPSEIQQFSKDSQNWWDENGPFKPLHRLNPTRLAYIKEQICAHYGHDIKALDALKGLDILDVGCGGGLVCEPLSRMGASTTGIDADEQAITVAKQHAQDNGLKIEYINGASENLDMQYDVVLALEVIEHVSDPQAFVEDISRLLKPDGIAIFSTLNRNPKSFVLGIVAAEYILNWVPKGTHSWKKFIKPSELSRFSRKAGLIAHNITGLIYNPVTDVFSLSKTDIDVNYFLSASKPD